MATMLDPARTLLLAMDFQPSVVDRLEESKDVIDRVATAVNVVRAAGGSVGFVTVGLTGAERMAVPESNSMFWRLRSHGSMTAGTPETTVVGRLAPRPGDLIVRKRRVGSFSTTDLHQQLTSRSIDTLVLCGITTSGCVLSTVREAADRDYRVVVLADGCVDFDPVAHRILLEVIFPKQAVVASVVDLTGMWI
ncbi:cysteine hydrolase family protein [Microbacterium sp. A84]|uniref:cysteine hydrolase family protein n=1 Tax=Microbacterium sp. A84 TaxID=3450715 RepID=UPI003F43029C